MCAQMLHAAPYGMGGPGGHRLQRHHHLSYVCAFRVTVLATTLRRIGCILRGARLAALQALSPPLAYPSESAFCDTV